VRLLLGIGDPRTGIRAATPVDGAGEDACLGDIVIAGFRRLVAQRHIGFAPRSLSTLGRATSAKPWRSITRDRDQCRKGEPVALIEIFATLCAWAASAMEQRCESKTGRL